MSTATTRSGSPRPPSLRAAALALLLLAAPLAWAQSTALSAGEAIYRRGVLPSGAPLTATREAGFEVRGADAACVNCHKRSGFGASEGEIIVPPVTQRYLFRPGGASNEDLDYRYLQSGALARTPYTEATLARAIREGLGRHAQQLNYLMPRYQIDDVALQALVGYLKALSAAPPPGVGADTLQFATIVTPDADPARREGMLSVMNQFVADKNAYTRAGIKPMYSAKGVAYRVKRHWQLHVWELTGLPDTWEAQLDRKLAAEPVFAVISGVAGSTWAPVHRFCERQGIPCLLPNVDLPVVAERDFFPVYYSRGVLLESDLLAQRIASTPVKRVVQVFRRDDVGRDAAAALRAALSVPGAVAVASIPIFIDHELPSGAMGAALAAALKGSAPGDALVLWLRPQDLTKLPAAPPSSVAVYLSGLLGGLENAPLPRAWRSAALMAYPFDPPELRKFRMNFPLGWFKVRQIPVVDERIMSDTYVACGIVAESVQEMLDSFSRDYLVERVEMMMSRKATTGYYPRLGLAIGQRFASKGGYLVRFTEPEGKTVAVEGDWVVP